MHTVRCKFCKQMFSFDGLPPESCPPCKERKDMQFQRVREIIKSNPGISALEVHERTNVPLPAIVRYIESGVIEIVSVEAKLDNVDMQLWIDKKVAKGQAAKKEAAKKEAAKREEDRPPDEEPPSYKPNKARMNFIVK